MRCFALLVLLLAAFVTSALSETYLVRSDGQGDYATIQEAVDAVADGAVIELADGVFTGEGNRDIELRGKAITIRSQSGDASSCIIDVEGVHNGISQHGFYLHEGEGPASVLDGFTIRNAVADGP